MTHQGVAYWAGRLDLSRAHPNYLSRSDFVSVFVDAALTFNRNDPQYRGLSEEVLDAAQLRHDLLANKVAVALQFTSQMGTFSNVPVEHQDDPENDPSYIASIKILSEVSESPESVRTATKFFEYMQHNIIDQIFFINKVSRISAPIANAGQNLLIHENETAVLNASRSFDFNGQIVRYTWSEGDETIGLGSPLSGLVLSPGWHTITLTVTDNDGNTDSDMVRIKVNRLPNVVIEGNLTNIWGVDAEFDGTESSDPDGNIVQYAWSNGEQTKKAIFENLPLGRNTIGLSLTDNDGGVATKNVTVNTLMCEGQENIGLINDVNGTVNMEPHTNRVSCYKINLSANNGIEKYALYMNLYENTVGNDSYNTLVEIYEEDGTLLKKFNTRYMDTAKHWIKQQFEISSDGDYYIKIIRNGNYAAKYAFSIHPSVDNGLVQDDKGEINDFKSMATALELNANNTLSDVTGTLNIKRKAVSSIKNTDDTDWYSLDFKAPGTYSFYMYLDELTARNDSYNVDVKIFDEYGTLIKTFYTRYMDATGHWIKEQFTIPSEGKYFIWIARNAKYSAKYLFSIHPSVDNGLVQDDKGEINDFKSMATALELNANNTLSDVTGTLNIKRKAVSSIKNTDDTDWYSLDFKAPGTYSFYMYLDELTARNDSYNVGIKIFDEYGTLIKTFYTRYMDATGHWIKEQFTIPSEGKYFIWIARNAKYSAKYLFSIHPSVDNGLVQDDKGEINDFKSMATALELNANNTLSDVTGTLNIKRKAVSSIKNTDDTDWYSLDFKAPGTYSFYMYLDELTARNDSYNVGIKIFDEYGTLIKTFDTRYMDSAGDNIDQPFTIPSEGKYFIWIARNAKYATKYKFSLSLK